MPASAGALRATTFAVLNAMWQTVHWYFKKWGDDGMFTDLDHDLNGLVRSKSGRTTTPTASIMDAESVKTSTDVLTSTQGIDAGRRLVPPARHRHRHS
jgi:transposase